MALSVSKIDKLLELFSSSDDEQLDKAPDEWDEHERSDVPEFVDKNNCIFQKFHKKVKSYNHTEKKKCKYSDTYDNNNIKMVELEVKPIMIEDSASESELGLMENNEEFANIDNRVLCGNKPANPFTNANKCLLKKSSTERIIKNNYVWEEKKTFGETEPKKALLEFKRLKIKNILKEQTCNIEGKTRIKGNRKQVKRNLKCKECNKKMKNEQLFMLHMQIHDNRKETECILCNQEYEDVNAVLEHYASFDKNKDNAHYVKLRPFPCHLCDLRYKTRKHLTDHLDIHAGHGKYLCPICGKRFFKGFNLTIHLKVHEKSYHSCERCNKNFRNVREYQAHQRNIHGENNITCPICNRPFSRRNNMKKHMETHERVYNQCILCNINFEFRRDFNQHMREIHNRIKKYTCSICGKIFSLHCKLTRHLETHSRIKDFCTICEKEFRNRRDYNAHMRNIHGVISGFPKKESKNDTCKVQFKIIHDVQVNPSTNSNNIGLNGDVKINIKIDINCIEYIDKYCF